MHATVRPAELTDLRSVCDLYRQLQPTDPPWSSDVAAEEALRKVDTARPFFERAGLEGVIVLRPVSLDREQTYTPDTWAMPYYGSLWGYYGYGWGSVTTGGYISNTTVLTVETLIFSLPKDRLIWAGVSETEDPKDAQRVVADLVKSAAKELKKQGLTDK